MIFSQILQVKAILYYKLNMTNYAKLIIVQF